MCQWVDFVSESGAWFRLSVEGVAYYPLILLVFHFCILFCNSITRRAQLAYIHNLFHCASWSGYHQKILNTHLDHCIIISTIHMLLFHPRKNVQRHISKFCPHAAISEKWVWHIIPPNEEESSLIPICGFVMLLQWCCGVHLTPMAGNIQNYQHCEQLRVTHSTNIFNERDWEDMRFVE